MLDFRSFFGKRYGYPEPLDGSDVFFFGFARTALMYGLKALGIQKGGTVLIPSYICNVVLAPFNYTGINVEYFDVKRDLSPDIDDIKSKITKNAKAILAVNYFGFPSKIDEIKRVCAENRLLYIEDNAHGFLSGYQGHPLGSFGDISIFSIRKTLPVPNGAALKINNSRIFANIDPLLKAGRGDAAFLLRQLNLNIEDVFGVNLVKALKNPPGKNDIYDPKDESIEEETNLEKYLVRRSKLAEFIAKRSDYENIKKVRRNAFSYLLRTVKDAEPVFKELPDGVVPYAFPVYVKDVKGFIRDMCQKGIYCSPWPTLPSSLKECPGFYRQVVLVPVWREYGN